MLPPLVGCWLRLGVSYSYRNNPRLCRNTPHILFPSLSTSLGLGPWGRLSFTKECHPIRIDGVLVFFAPISDGQFTLLDPKVKGLHVNPDRYLY